MNFQNPCSRRSHGEDMRVVIRAEGDSIDKNAVFHGVLNYPSELFHTFKKV